MRVPSPRSPAHGMRALLALTALAAAPQLRTGFPAHAAEADPDRLLNAATLHLREDPFLGPGTARVAVASGVVTLTGTVPDIFSKRRAEDLVASVRGVRAVVNRIEVRPSPRSDLDIKRAAETALREVPALSDAKVTVDARQGVVFLKGDIASAADERIARRAVERVTGVRGVRSELAPGPAVDRTDADVRREIGLLLRYDVHLGDDPLAVAVADGTVRLEGAVDSAWERARAEQRARIQGVDAVDASDVRVDSAQSAQKPAKPFEPQDKDIRSAVVSALKLDPRVASAGVGVTVRNGTVRLEGNVATLAAARAAEEDARNVRGVENVIARLTVSPARAFSREELARIVGLALKSNPWVGAEDMQALVIGAGTVQLVGRVSSPAARSEAIKTAESVPGVVRIVDLLKQTAEIEQSDRELAAEIQERLLWSPLLERQKIQVQVRGGVATLSGVVDSLAAKDLAADLARASGVQSVVNHLRMDPVDGTGRGAFRSDPPSTERASGPIRFQRVADPAGSRPLSTAVEGVEARLADAFPEISRGITVKPIGGGVALEGQVPSLLASIDAARLADSTHGVGRVDNRLRVMPRIKLKDSLLKTQLENAIGEQLALQDDRVRVQVRQGRVALQGEVDAQQERQFAHDILMLNPAVVAIDLSGLIASPTAKSAPALPSEPEPVLPQTATAADGRDLTRGIVFRMSSDPRVAPFDIRVSDARGLITLEGTVSTLAGKLAAESIVRDTPDVWGVRNVIEVLPAGTVTDGVVLSVIEDAFRAVPYLSRGEIQTINVRNGRVQLFGEVDSPFERRRATEIAASVYGVRHVDNNLWIETGSNLSDRSLRFEIETALRLDDRVEEQAIRVDARNGAATLSGVVPTLRQWHLAQEIARSAGATSVSNEISIAVGEGA